MKILLAVFFALIMLPAYAANRTVTLSVPGMTCAACPITVKAALSKVPGVKQIKVDYNKRIVVVAYDDDKTSVTALTNATRDAGYPSIPAEAK